MTNTHPYQVRKWLPQEPALKYLGHAHWMEECRCQTQDRAEIIARALYLAGNHLLAVVKIVDPPAEGTSGRIAYVAWYPDRETVERKARP